MKTKLILGSLLALSGMIHAQTWAGSTTSTGNAYRSGNVGIGNTAPAYALDITTSTSNGGLSITQTGNNNGTLRLVNTSAGGHNYGITSTGLASSEGVGNFGLYDYTSSAYRFFIKSNGNFGIGTISPGYKLHVESDDALMVNNPIYMDGGFFYEPTYAGAYSKLTATLRAGAHTALQGYDLNNCSSPQSGQIYLGVGVCGKAERTGSYFTEFVNVGVSGRALGASANAGGAFYGDSYGYGGAKTTPDAGNARTRTSYGIWASAYGKDAMSGYFNGEVYSNVFYQNADSKLQNDITPLKNSIEKLKLLQVNSFTFNRDENNYMNLPEGEQMGLSIVELEKVFPNLVKNLSETSTKMQGKVADEKSFKAANYTNLIPLLISGMQEQQKQLEDQNKTNEDLKNLVALQQQRINDMQAKISGATGISDFNAPIDGFSMDQNVPNPFSNETVIRYNLPQTVGNAYMNVYDLNGKQITSFPLNQKGSASVTITSEKLTAGIYIYSIVADGKVMDSKRMIVEEKH